MLREPDLTPTPPALDWSVWKPEKAEKIVGVIAGRVRKFRCHHVGPKRLSKPCVAFATDGKLECWCAERPAELRDVVYVPLYTRGEQMVIRVSEYAGYKLESDFKPGQMVEFTRPEKVKRPMQFKRPDAISKDQAWVVNKAKKCDADILEFLCHVWQLHDLTRFCGFTPRRSLRVATKADITEPDYSPRFAHTERQLTERLKREAE